MEEDRPEWRRCIAQNANFEHQMWSTATNDLTQYFAVRKRFFNSGYIANQEFLAEAAKQYVSECDANLISYTE